MHAALIEHHEAIGIFEGERLEENAAHDREQRHIGADAERHDQNGNDGESGSAEQGAECIADVAEDGFEPVPTPGGAGLIAEERGIAEGAESGVASFLGVHAGGDVFGDLAIEVELKFVIEVRGGRACGRKSIRIRIRS